MIAFNYSQQGDKICLNKKEGKISLQEQFELKWEHPRYFSPLKVKNMKILFKNLGIQVVSVCIEKSRFRNYVLFTLLGTKEQQNKLNDYMETIKKIVA